VGTIENLMKKSGKGGYENNKERAEKDNTQVYEIYLKSRNLSFAGVPLRKRLQRPKRVPI
jgi:hypothetical protein